MINNGFNNYTLRKYKKSGLIKDYTAESLLVLKEPDHYVICPYCGKKFLEVTDRHYRQFHSLETDRPVLHSKMSWELKIRAIRALNDRTRSERVKKLVLYNKTEKGRERVRKQSLEKWKDPGFRGKIELYQKSCRLDVISSALHARSFNRKKASDLHLFFKAKMVQAGISGFETETVVGPYSIDEADVARKIAVEIDGCYFHGCEVCGYSGCPSTVLTDKRKTGYLIKRGWRIIRIPEHDIRKNIEFCLLRLNF